MARTRALPDLVVPVGPGLQSQELRYAVRSWAAMVPHRRLWVVGYRPAWLEGVRYLPTIQRGTKYQNSTANVRAACENPSVSDEFILMNDDFFVMRPLRDGMPVHHRGPVRDVETYYIRKYGKTTKYLRGLRETRDLLVRLGHRDPLSYELHVPLVVNKAAMLETLKLAAKKRLDVVHKRTLYGVMHGIGGTRLRDVKILHRAPAGYKPTQQFLSTMPDSFTRGAVGRHIRATFPRPCRYEKAGRPR